MDRTSFRNLPPVEGAMDGSSPLLLKTRLRTALRNLDERELQEASYAKCQELLQQVPPASIDAFFREVCSGLDAANCAGKRGRLDLLSCYLPVVGLPAALPSLPAMLEAVIQCQGLRNAGVASATAALLAALARAALAAAAVGWSPADAAPALAPAPEAWPAQLLLPSLFTCMDGAIARLELDKFKDCSSGLAAFVAACAAEHGARAGTSLAAPLAAAASVRDIFVALLAMMGLQMGAAAAVMGQRRTLPEKYGEALWPLRGCVDFLASLEQLTIEDAQMVIALASAGMRSTAWRVRVLAAQLVGATARGIGAAHEAARGGAGGAGEPGAGAWGRDGPLGGDDAATESDASAFDGGGSVDEEGSLSYRRPRGVPEEGEDDGAPDYADDDGIEDDDDATEDARSTGTVEAERRGVPPAVEARTAALRRMLAHISGAGAARLFASVGPQVDWSPLAALLATAASRDKIAAVRRAAKEAVVAVGTLYRHGAASMDVWALDMPTARLQWRFLRAAIQAEEAAAAGAPPPPPQPFSGAPAAAAAAGAGEDGAQATAANSWAGSPARHSHGAGTTPQSRPSPSRASPSRGSAGPGTGSPARLSGGHRLSGGLPAPDLHFASPLYTPHVGPDSARNSLLASGGSRGSGGGPGGSGGPGPRYSSPGPHSGSPGLRRGGSPAQGSRAASGHAATHGLAADFAEAAAAANRPGPGPHGSPAVRAELREANIRELVLRRIREIRDAAAARAGREQADIRRSAARDIAAYAAAVRAAAAAAVAEAGVREERRAEEECRALLADVLQLAPQALANGHGDAGHG